MKLVLLAAALAAQQPAQFDLMCSGTYDSVASAPAPYKSYTAHIRVDLARDLWCQGDCSAPARIFDVSPTLITLTNSIDENLTPDSAMHVEHVINRQTGGEMMRVDAGDVQTTYLGNCERRPFSGFPPIRRKF